jgi:hypothetical protein
MIFFSREALEAPQASELSIKLLWRMPSSMQSRSDRSGSLRIFRMDRYFFHPGNESLNRRETMNKGMWILAPLALLSAAAFAASDRNARVPVLLELFTSEGCSSCPPADRLLAELDEKQPLASADLIVLSEHVDYWDQLGWRDRFSSPQFTARQQNYSARYRFDGVYTPQLAIDGRYGVVGSDARAVMAAIGKASRETKVPVQVANSVRKANHIQTLISVDATAGRSGVLYVAIADSRADSQVARGENSGRQLSHVAVVRALQQMGPIEAGGPLQRTVSISIPADAGTRGLRVVAFLQDPKTGHILGVGQQML